MGAVRKGQAEAVLAAVAAWLGDRGWGDEPGVPVPTGPEAARRALGPELVMDWDWPGRPTPSVLLEGGPDSWAIEAAYDTSIRQRAEELGVFLEPYAAYALCIYPA